MAVGSNVPVIVGAVPLFQVQQMTLSEGYRVEKIAGSRFSQLVAPSDRTIQIEALLTGRERQITRKGLEYLALTSRWLAAASAPAFVLAGVPFISLFTIALDMHIKDLRFIETVDKRDAITASITLQHVPRHIVFEALGEFADLTLAIASATLPTTPVPNPIPRA